MLDRIGFGGGCHWCTEAVFQALRGVEHVAQGLISALPPDDRFSEAVLVDFDPARITLADLVEVHLRTHASTSAHRMRGKYRSAIYVFSTGQDGDAAAILNALGADFDAPLVTRVLRFDAFRPSPPQFLDYYVRNAGKPFCRSYIDPKLAMLRSGHARLMG